jgi:hypothetical protein
MGVPGLKHKLLTYNTEDCEALERVSNAVARLCQREAEETNFQYWNWSISISPLIGTISEKKYILDPNPN